MIRLMLILGISAALLFVGGIHVFADCTWDCHPHELGDVVYMICVYRGILQPGRLCDCGQYGEQFPVCADYNGNCIPFELADLVGTVESYRGNAHPELCPDCL